MTGSIKDPTVADATPTLDEVHAFLLGEGPLDRKWFGERHAKLPLKSFWWRKFLRAAMEATRTATNRASEGEATLGVGDGSGQLFVHGSYEAIKRVQGMILELERLTAKDRT